MKSDFTKEDIQTARKYFLGQTTDADRDAIENRFFIDENYSYFLDDIERDLIADYVGENLSEADRKGFEVNYLVSEERREKLRFGKALHQKVATKTATAETVASSPGVKWFDIFKIPRFAFAGGLGILILLIGIVGIGIIQNRTIDQVQKNGNIDITTPDPKTTSSPSDIPDSNVPANRPGDEKPSNRDLSDSNKNSAGKKPDVTPQSNKTRENSNLNPPTENQNAKPPQTAFASLILLPATRGTARPVVEIKDQQSGLMLTIVCDDCEQFQSFNIQVSSASREIVMQRTFKNTSSKSAKTFVLQIPANKISNGQFEVNLSGVNENARPKPLNFYEFTVSKK